MISCTLCNRQAVGCFETMISQYGWQVIDGTPVCSECIKELAGATADYYTLNGIECKDVIGGLPAFTAFAMKYLFRAGKKAGNSYEADIQKAINYLNFELERIKKNE